MSKTRKLLNGQRVGDAPKSVQMTIDSKCPKKWLFVDMETGDVWVHRSRLKNPPTNDVFFRADEKAIGALQNIATEITVRELGIYPEVS